MAPRKKKTTAEGNSLVKPKGLFDHIRHIREVQDPNYFDTLSDVDLKSWSNYMICRFLSMSPGLIVDINAIQRYQSLKPRQFYTLCIAVVPRAKCFDPYVKKKTKSRWKSSVLEILRKHYQESEVNVEEYIEILGNNEVEKILALYGYNEKDILKLKSED
jgi:hypothetical protein